MHAPEAPSRRERQALSALLVAFVTLRLVLIARSPLHLFQGEEFVQLRLYRQIAADLPLDSLTWYAYGDGTGLTGGGSLVLAVLYLAVAPLFGTGYVAIKAMALAWALAGAVGVASLARRTVGPWGGVAAVGALLAMPPAYTVHSSIAWGSHAEGGVVLLGALWAFARIDDGGPATRARRAVVAGAAAAFATWFWPPALLAVGPLGLATLVLTRGRDRLAWPAGFAGVGAALVLLVDFNTSLSDGGNSTASIVSTATARIRSVGPLGLIREFGSAVPFYDVAWTGRWTPGEGLGLIGGFLVTGAWFAVAGTARAAARRMRTGLDPFATAALLAAIAASVAVPAVLVLADAAMPRRMTPVYLLWAVAFAPLGPRLLERGGRRAAAAGVLVAGLMVPSWLLALTGPADPVPPLERWVLCPAGEPRLESGICLRVLGPGHLPVLARLDEDPRITSPSLRIAALRAVDMAMAAQDDFALTRALGRCHPPGWGWRIPELGMDAAHDRLAWHYLGASGAVSCTPAGAERNCREWISADPPMLEACLEGVDSVR